MAPGLILSFYTVFNGRYQAVYFDAHDCRLSITNNIDSDQMLSKRAFDSDPNCWKLQRLFLTIQSNRARLRIETDTIFSADDYFRCFIIGLKNTDSFLHDVVHVHCAVCTR